MLPVEQPFKTYTGLDGKPLDNGYVYFGEPGQDPIAHPVTVYWDAAGTLPAAQPLRTVNGYIMNAGTPANVFSAGSYSELVKNSKGQVVFSAPTSVDFSIASLVSGLAGSGGAAGVGFSQSGTGAVAETVQSALRRMVVDLEDFGGSGDWNGSSGTDCTNAIKRAIAKLGSKGGIIRVHPGAYCYDPTAIGTINAPIIFQGDGRLASSLVKVGNGIGLSFGTGAAYGGITDLMLDSASGHGDTSDGMYVSAGRILVRGAGIQNHGGKGLNLYAANCSTFSDLMIVNCADDLIYINGNPSAPDVNAMTFTGLDLRVSTNGAAFRNVNGFSNFVFGLSAQGCVNGGAIVMGGSRNIVRGVYSENNGGSALGALQFTSSANYNVVEFGLATDLGAVSNAAGTNSYILPNDTRSNERHGSMTVLQDALINNASVGNGPGNSTSNTRVGTNALTARTTGFNDTAVGNMALGSVTTGSYNTAYGYFALRDMVTGDACTAIGYQAGRYKQDGTSMTGVSGVTCIGSNASVSGANQVQLGDSSTTTYVYGTVQNRSDARDKADIRDTVLGLDFINALRPVDYRWDMRVDYFEDVKDEDGNVIGRRQLPYDGSKKRKRLHHGVIAQELKAASDALGVDFGGYQDHSINGGGDVLSIGYDEFIGPLIRAVQELSARLTAAGL